MNDIIPTGAKGSIIALVHYEPINHKYYLDALRFSEYKTHNKYDLFDNILPKSFVGIHDMIYFILNSSKQMQFEIGRITDEYEYGLIYDIDFVRFDMGEIVNYYYDD